MFDQSIMVELIVIAQVPALPLAILRKINAAPEDDDFATARSARVSSNMSSPTALAMATARPYLTTPTGEEDISIADAVLALLDTPPERPGDVFEFTPLPELELTEEITTTEEGDAVTPFIHVPCPPAYPTPFTTWPNLDDLPPVDTEEEEEPVESLGARLAAVA